LGTAIPIVAALAGAFFFLKGMFDEIVAEFKLDELFEKLIHLISGGSETAKGFGDKLGLSFGDIIPIIKSVMVVIEAFGKIFAKVLIAIIKMNVSFYGSLWENARDTFKWIGDNWSALWSNSFDLLVAFGKDVIGVAKEIGKQLWSALKGDGFDLSAITDSVAANFKKALKEAGIEDIQLRNPFAESKDIFTGMIDGIGQVVTDMNDKIYNLANASLDLGNAAKDVSDAADKQSKAAKDSADANSDTAKVVKDGFVNVQRNMENALVQGTMAAYRAEAQQSMPVADRAMKAAEKSVAVQKKMVKQQEKTNEKLSGMGKQSSSVNAGVAGTEFFEAVFVL